MRNLARVGAVPAFVAIATVGLFAQNPASAQTFSIIDYPSAFRTYPGGINNSGQIVGDFSQSNTSVAQGYIDNGGVFTALSAPLSQNGNGSGKD